jgi:diaminohydroxyphosphoribosylaminopyrimidine deaminase/5-amino-6-(5-phosphoribosylamino)uracil reductase
VVGAGTVIADNPRLTCRIPNGRDPVRVVVDARLRTSPRALMFTEASGAGALLVTTPANLRRARKRYASARVEVLACHKNKDGIDLHAMLRELAKRGWCKVMFEGGSRLAGSALEANVVDRIALFVAPKIVGTGLPAVQGLSTGRIRDALRLDNFSVRRVGDDVLLEGRPSR